MLLTKYYYSLILLSKIILEIMKYIAIKVFCSLERFSFKYFL